MPYAFPNKVEYQPSTEWFNRSVTKDVALAPIPGTANLAAMAEYGAINVHQKIVVEYIHFHLFVDGNSGQYDLEVYRYRSSTFLKVATVSLANGGGNNSKTTFTWVDEDYKNLERDDYLYLQATAKMGGSPKGFVDCHFLTVRI